MRFLPGVLILGHAAVPARAGQFSGGCTMRRNCGLLSLGLVILSAAFVAAPAAASQMYVPGSWNVDSWNPNSNAMTDNLDGTHSITISNQTPGQRYQFKIVEDTNSDGGDWGPDPNRPGSGNGWVNADGSGNVAINFNTNVVSDGWSTSQYRISGNAANMDPGAWTFVGDFQSELGGSDWTNNYAGTAMTSLGGGIYEWVGSIPVGSYIGKATNTGTWDAIGADNRSINADNFSFTVNAPTDTVRFRVDALNSIAQISVVPEPATALLAGFGCLLAWGAGRRR